MFAPIVEGYNYTAQEQIFAPQTLIRSFAMTPISDVVADAFEFDTNDVFWKDVFDEQLRAGNRVTLRNFNIFEWFPRNPGLFHTPKALWSREDAANFVRGIDEEKYCQIAAAVDASIDHASAFRRMTEANETKREMIYRPEGKLCMLEGGIGCIRLCPFELRDGGDTFWWMSATSSTSPDEGIPIVLPDHLYNTVIDEIRNNGFASLHIHGRVKFVPEKYRDLFAEVRNIPRLYVLVDAAERLPRQEIYGSVSVVASFVSDYQGFPQIYATYVTFDPGFERARDRAAEWLREDYVNGLYDGDIITDFDEQSPVYADALFSLAHCRSSPDLVEQIMKFKELYGNFDLTALERYTFSYTKNEGDLMIKVENSQNVNVSAAKGKGATATATFTQTMDSLKEINLAQLSKELGALRASLGEGAQSAEIDLVKGAVAQAEMAAAQGDQEKTASALEGLKPFGAKVLNIAEKIGVSLATTAIKSALGL
jgi:hypothetical protein